MIFAHVLPLSGAFSTPSCRLLPPPLNSLALLTPAYPETLAGALLSPGKLSDPGNKQIPVYVGCGLPQSTSHPVHFLCMCALIWFKFVSPTECELWGRRGINLISGSV